MKNREEIKKALLLYMESKMRMKCKENKMSRRATEDAIASVRHEVFEKGAEQLLKEYENNIYDEIANKLSQKVKLNLSDSFFSIEENIGKLSSTSIDDFLGLKSEIRDVQFYNRVIRKNILSDEVKHLEFELALLDKHSKALHRIAELESKKVSWMFVLVLISSLILWCVLIYKFGWDSMEKWTYLSALAILVLNAVYFALFERHLTSESIKKKRLESNKKHLYDLYKYDKSYCEGITEILLRKKEELENIKAATNNA